MRSAYIIKWNLHTYQGKMNFTTKLPFVVLQYDNVRRIENHELLSNLLIRFKMPYILLLLHSKHTMKSIWFHFLSHTYLQKRKSLKLHSWRNFNAFKLRSYYVSNITGFIQYTIIGGIEAIDDTSEAFCALLVFI